MIAALRPQFWWYLARSSGIVAWVLLASSTFLGLLVATRMVPLRAPRWLLDMHRHVGGLAVGFTALHLAGLVIDSYLTFSWAEILVPYASAYEPGAVAWGVVALYLLVAVEATSLAMRSLPRRAWRAVHLTSYAAFVMVTLHAVLAGTDRDNLVFVMTGSAFVGLVAFALVVRVLSSRRPGRPR